MAVADQAGKTLILILIIEVKQRNLSLNCNCVKLKSAVTWYLTGQWYWKLNSLHNNIQKVFIFSWKSQGKQYLICILVQQSDCLTPRKHFSNSILKCLSCVVLWKERSKHDFWSFKNSLLKSGISEILHILSILHLLHQCPFVDSYFNPVSAAISSTEDFLKLRVGVSLSFCLNLKLFSF